MVKRLTRDELEKELQKRDAKISDLYEEANTAYIRAERERAEGYKDAMRDVISLLHDIFGKEKQ